MAKDEDLQSFAAGGRDKFHPDGWVNERDREDDEPQDIGRRLTAEERQPRFNVEFDQDGNPITG